MKKILVVTNRSYQLIGGIEKHVYEVNKGITSQNADVSVLHVAFSSRSSETVTINHNYIVKHIKTPFLFDGLYPFLSPRAFLDLYRVIKEFKPDVIHTHNRYMLSTIAAQIIALMKRIPNVHTEHASSGNTFSNPLLSAVSDVLDKTVIYFLLHKSAVITAVSKSSRAFMERTFGLKNILVTTNFINTDDIDQATQNETLHNKEKINCLFVGRLVESKGYKQLSTILANAEKQFPEFEFGIIGGGEGSDAMKKLSNDNTNVTYFGELPRKDVLKNLFHTDIYMNLSSLEGLSTTIMEAVYLNKVVLATPIAPNRELLEMYPKAVLSQSDVMTQNEFSALLETAKNMVRNVKETTQKAVFYDFLTNEESIKQYCKAYSIANTAR